jgi:hypothetical protein
MPKTKGLWDIELLDTSSHQITHKGVIHAAYPLQAERAFAKTLPKSINLAEMRDSKYGRYAFLSRRRK